MDNVNGREVDDSGVSCFRDVGRKKFIKFHSQVTTNFHHGAEDETHPINSAEKKYI